MNDRPTWDDVLSLADRAVGALEYVGIGFGAGVLLALLGAAGLSVAGL